jgi:hypothetical protein
MELLERYPLLEKQARFFSMVSNLVLPRELSASALLGISPIVEKSVVSALTNPSSFQQIVIGGRIAFPPHESHF